MDAPYRREASHVQSEVKRRKLRKGTHSCWECKRRKMRCIFDPLANVNICNGCKRRGSPCVSQEYPEEVSTDVGKGYNKAGGIMRVETLYAGDGSARYDEGISATPSEDGRRGDNGIPTPVSTISESSQYLAFYKAALPTITNNNFPPHTTHTSAAPGRHEHLSRFLHDSLPSREDTEKICRASRHPAVLSHEIMTMPYSTLDQSGLKTPETLLDIPGPTEHPVLIARHMLLLVTYLQHLHPDLHKEIKGLSESSRSIMERLAELAIRLVTTNDELLGSVEALECVMIESVYQANIGNLRRSWVAGRRALNAAQMMGFNQPERHARYKVLDPETTYHPELMWFRIVFFDRYLCLMLGLSQGCHDQSMASDQRLAGDTPMGRLERIHCSIASQILERNESKKTVDDLALTRTLDVELQRAARSLPSSWWIAPNFDRSSNDSQALFWNTRRMFAQLFHYNLLNQLHLPYMLHSSSTERRNDYSRMTCANASREVLSRFITLRNFNNIACSCRTIDFLALMSAMTLLLVHLDSNLSEAENLLAHQYHSDRAMIEQVQKNMEEVNRLNSDALSAQSADLLRRLLAIEVDPTGGDQRRDRTVSVQEPGSEVGPSEPDGDTVVSVHIPYFGIINIAREGMSREALKPMPDAAPTRLNPQPQILDDSTVSTNTGSPYKWPYSHSLRLIGPGASRGGTDAETMTPVNTPDGRIYTTSMTPGTALKSSTQPHALNNSEATATPDLPFDLESQPQNPLADPVPYYDQYPGLTAGGEDWVFQGVDLAFFESLMRSTEAGGSEDTR